MKVIWTGLIALAVASIVSQPAAAAGGHSAEHANAHAQRVIEYWTPARRAAATPRDLAIDGHGQGYLRGKDGSFAPYSVKSGPQLSAESPTPMAKGGSKGGGGGGGSTGGGGGGGGGDAPPTIGAMSPDGSATITTSALSFSVDVDDDNGVRSVTVYVSDGSSNWNFGASQVSSTSDSAGVHTTWQVDVSGFANGNWSWYAVAKDTAKRGGQTATSPTVGFTVDIPTSGGGGGGSTVTNAPWTGGGAVQTAAGRIYFEMPSNADRTQWGGYVCSGTVANDGGVGDRSVIITASHCIYDDANKAFARNVLFIPDQAGTTGTGTDLNCGNDPLGCWVPSYGVVDVNWTTRTFPDNVAWDYAFYVVDNVGAHQGTATASDVLDAEAGALDVSFAAPAHDTSDYSDYTHALGYSYSDDPNFMYCAEAMTTNGSADWWLGSCDLSGGSSGGPWMQPVENGNGPIISVNSWGYTRGSGMAGPKLSGTSAECVFNSARTTAFGSVPSTDGDAGVIVTCP